MCSLLLLEASRLSPYTPPAADAGNDSVDSRPTKFQKKTFTDTKVSSPLSVVEGSGAFRKHRDTGRRRGGVTLWRRGQALSWRYSASGEGSAVFG